MIEKEAFKVGVASFLMASLIGALFVWKSSIYLKATGTEIIGNFDNVGGLLNGADVRYRGVKVGKIFSVTPKRDRVLVSMRIKPGVTIPKSSSAHAIFDGLVGEKFLSIRHKEVNEQNLKSGDIIPGFSNAGLADFVEEGTESLVQVNQLLESFRRALTGTEVETALSDSLIGIKSIVSNLKEITRELKTLTSQANLNEIVGGFEAFGESLNKISGKIENAVLSDDMLKNYESTAENFSMFSNKLYSFSDRLDKFLLGDETTEPSSAMNLFRTINTMTILPGAKIQYSEVEKVSSFVVNLDWDFGKSFFRTGYGDAVESINQMMNIQYGRHLTKTLTARMGLFYTKPGIGLDMSLMDRLEFEMEIYNFQRLQIDLTAKFKLIDELSSIITLKQNPTDLTSYDNLNLGFSYQL